jgi:hypothetical protein
MLTNQAIDGLPALGLIVGIGAVALIGVVLMIAHLCRQLVVQTGLSYLCRQPIRRVRTAHHNAKQANRCAVRTLREGE